VLSRTLEVEFLYFEDFTKFYGLKVHLSRDRSSEVLTSFFEELPVFASLESWLSQISLFIVSYEIGRLLEI
jgi:hypothetical protein